MGIALGFPFLHHMTVMLTRRDFGPVELFESLGAVFSSNQKNLFKIQLTPQMGSLRSPFWNHYSESQWESLVELG